MSSSEMEKLMRNAIIISCFLGIFIASYLIWYHFRESYSALYLIPESYTNYVEGDTISFVYGVKSYETKRTKYNLKIYLGGRLEEEKVFWLESGEKREEEVSLRIPEQMEFPAKVRLVLEANGREYDVHFWLKGRRQ